MRAEHRNVVGVNTPRYDTSLIKNRTAIGVWLWARTQTDDFDITVARVVEKCCMAPNTARAALNRLIDLGLLVRFRGVDEECTVNRQRGRLYTVVLDAPAPFKVPRGRWGDQRITLEQWEWLRRARGSAPRPMPPLVHDSETSPWSHEGHRATFAQQTKKWVRGREVLRRARAATARPPLTEEQEDDVLYAWTQGQPLPEPPQDARSRPARPRVRLVSGPQGSTAGATKGEGRTPNGVLTVNRPSDVVAAAPTTAVCDAPRRGGRYDYAGSATVVSTTSTPAVRPVSQLRRPARSGSGSATAPRKVTPHVCAQHFNDGVGAGVGASHPAQLKHFKTLLDKHGAPVVARMIALFRTETPTAGAPAWKSFAARSARLGETALRRQAEDPFVADGHGWFRVRTAQERRLEHERLAAIDDAAALARRTTVVDGARSGKTATQDRAVALAERGVWRRPTRETYGWELMLPEEIGDAFVDWFRRPGHEHLEPVGSLPAGYRQSASVA